MRKVLIAVGGSGGHLLPAQQLAFLLKSDFEVAFAGLSLSKSPFFNREGVNYKEIRSAPLSRPFKFLLQTFLGCLQSFRFLLSYRPDVVVGFGSFHSFPVLLIALLLRKKIVLYEANCVLGKVNRLLAPFTRVLAHQLPLSRPRNRSRFVSYFPWISTSQKYSQEEARDFYGFDLSSLVCLVFGGSQGASFLNQKAASVLSGCQVLHLTGRNETVDEVRALYLKSGIKAVVKGFEQEMMRAYAAADFVLCRSGAGTTTELIRHQIPAVLVPYPSAAEDHQTANARFFCEQVKGGVWVSQARSEQLLQAVQTCRNHLEEFRAALQIFQHQKETRVSLADLIREIV